MILSGQTIRELCRGEFHPHFGEPMLSPFVERGVQNGRSFGLSIAGYDIRCKQDVSLWPGDFELASSVEHFNIPNDVIFFVKDKSSWARQGLSVFNTVGEPGWKGYLTLELVNHGKQRLIIKEGDPIAQVIFQKLDQPAEKGYSGKYQNQEDRPVEARFEH